MSEVTGHNYFKTLLSGSCMVGNHTECDGVSWVGIKALRRPCDCQCHADAEQYQIPSV